MFLSQKMNWFEFYYLFQPTKPIKILFVIIHQLKNIESFTVIKEHLFKMAEGNFLSSSNLLFGFVASASSGQML